MIALAHESCSVLTLPSYGDPVRQEKSGRSTEANYAKEVRGEKIEFSLQSPALILFPSCLGAYGLAYDWALQRMGTQPTVASIN